MSNKIVPHIYRTIIDDVIVNVRVDFEEYGMDEEVLTNLQAKWEAKLLETRVADFARAPGTASTPDGEGDEESVDPSLRFSDHDSQAGSARPGEAYRETYGYSGTPSAFYGSAYGSNGVRAGSGGVNGNGIGNGVAGGSGGGGMGLALPGMNGNGYDDVRVKTEPEDVLRVRGGAGEEVKPDVGRRPEPNAAGLLPGDEVIDSDLDDSEGEFDEDEDGDEDGAVDIVFCVYDKVQRVKNKWKTTFKDGMIHINGRDYLFAKCQGEFEW